MQRGALNEDVDKREGDVAEALKKQKELRVGKAFTLWAIFCFVNSLLYHAVKNEANINP